MAIQKNSTKDFRKSPAKVTEKPIIQMKKIKFQQICPKKTLKEKENVKKSFIE